MVSKPKSGLGKGLVRKLAQHQASASVLPASSHAYHHAIAHAHTPSPIPPYYLSSSGTGSGSGIGISGSSGGSGGGLAQPIALAPVVSHYHQHHYSTSRPYERSDHSSAAEATTSFGRYSYVSGEPLRDGQREKGKGKVRETDADAAASAAVLVAESEVHKDQAWPLLPAIPAAASVVGSPAYLALLPAWDGLSATFSASDTLVGKFSDMSVVSHYRHTPTSRSTARPSAIRASSASTSASPRSPEPQHVRRYTTSCAPARAAATASAWVQPSVPGAPPFMQDFPIPSSWPILRQSHLFHPPPPPPPASPPEHPEFQNYFSPPPPPPSPGPAQLPSKSINPNRPSESHTVLSPAPLAPTDSGGGGGNGSIGGVLSLGGSPSLSSDTSRVSSLNPAEAAPTEYATYSSQLIFRLGCSGLAKDRPIIPPRPSRGAASPTPPPRPRSFPLPHLDPPSVAELRSISVGEDSYFAQMDGICVADGVGGWARSGRGSADAGRWSRLLTHYIDREVRAWWLGAQEYLEDTPAGDEAATAGGGASGWSGIFRKRGETGTEGDSQGLLQGKRRRKLDPVEIMQRGFEKCLACVLTEGIYGSSTCILALLHHSTLLVANLGDCCLLVVRNGHIVFRTNEMQHAFNFPLQVGTHSRDEPMKDAKRFEVAVEERDVVIVGSDGLMDNLFDEDILDCLAEYAPPASPTPSTSGSTTTSPSYLPTPPDSRPPSTGGRPAFNPQKVSEALCHKAREVSEEPNATTPFMMRAIEEGIDFVGGKKDDITVVVGVVGSNGSRLHLNAT